MRRSRLPHRPRPPFRRCLPAVAALALCLAGPAAAQPLPGGPPAIRGRVYHVEYLRARPGFADDYDRFVENVFRPILDEMVRRGVWLRYGFMTVPYAGPAPCADYTHVFVAELRNFAAIDRELLLWDEVVAKFHPDAEDRRRLFDEELPRLREMVREEFLKDFEWK